ncbi:hypothetical protein ANCDUO_10093 [Ancylostoma duodenale]|uniref:Uncharacterized protein n=1 Tax=Ancylostoma duodenale TaxID=51022 RepID=A0A0C2GER6_9BILA|nr:hypothetical protein ANCDUO_10093 [Ancylostoma duodenale]
MWTECSKIGVLTVACRSEKRINVDILRFIGFADFGDRIMSPHLIAQRATMNGVGIALRRISQPCRRFLSTVSAPDDESSALRKMMPSEDFVKQFIKRPSHRDKLSSLVSELDISLINQRKEENGEMVYAPGFHSLLELRGQEFREVIDHIYGSRLLSMRRCGEDLPKLVVDCRFLSEFSVAVQSTFARQIQSLHDSNWTSRQPFDISVANFRPDSQLAEIVKRQIQALHDSNWTSRQPFDITMANFRPDSQLAEIVKRRP